MIFDGYKSGLVYLMKHAPHVDDPYMYICMLFLADIEGFKEGIGISNDEYIRTEGGICLKNAYQYLYNELLFRNIGKLYAEVDTVLSDKRKEIFDDIIEKYESLSLSTLKEKTRTPAWQRWTLKDRPIPFMSIVEDVVSSQRQLKQLEVDHHNWTVLNMIFKRPSIDLTNE